MRWSSLFNVVFLAGLLSGVRVMVAGVERRRGAGDAIVRSRLAMFAGSLSLAGFLGSLLLQLAASTIVVACAVVVGAIVGAVGARWVVRRAAAMPVSDHEFDPRFALQGVPAVVVEAIPAAGDGLVLLPVGSRDSALPIRARSLNGASIARGVEVGVERIHDEVAFVEEWSAIEARL